MDKADQTIGILTASKGCCDGFTVPGGNQSLAVEARIQPREKTLTDQDIEALANRIIAQVEKATGGALRR